MTQALLAFLLAAFLSPVAAQWKQTNGPKASPAVRCIAFTSTAMLVGGDEGIFRSSDSGKTWASAGMGGVSTQVHSLVQIRGAWLAGTASGLFRSGDDGKTWSPVTRGIPQTAVGSLAVAATGVIAGTEGGFYISSDNGASWSAAASNPPEPVGSMVAGSNVVIGGAFYGAYRSRDGGRNWTRVGSLPQEFANASALLAKGSDLFISGGSGTYRTSDGGDTWIPLETGLTLSPIPSMASAGSALFAAMAYDGIFRSLDNGMSWSPVSEQFLQNPVQQVAVHGDRVYAGTLGGSIYRSSASNPGSWTALGNHGFPYLSVKSAVAMGVRLFGLADDGSLFQSQDGGRLWAKKFPTPFYSETLFRWNKVLCAMAATGRVIASRDSGNSWRELVAGIPLPSRFLCFATTDTNLFVGTSRGLFRAGMGQPRWDSIGSLPSNWVITAIAARGRDVVVAGNMQGMRSHDAGKTWTTCRALPPSGRIRSLQFLDANLLAISDSGVVRSEDYGDSWVLAKDGIDGSPPRVLVAAKGTAYTATDRGIYFSRDQGRRWRQAGTGLDATVFALSAEEDQLLASTDAGVWSLSLSDLFPTSARWTPRSVAPGEAAFLPFGPGGHDALGRILSGGSRLRPANRSQD